MAPSVLYRVIHGTTTPSLVQQAALLVRPAVLEHYTRHRVAFCDYPAILPASEPSASVRGTFVAGLTEGDQWRLDIFEGDQYKRVRVKPKLLDEQGVRGEEVEAETYVWVDAQQGLEEGEWNFEEFRKEKMNRWVGSTEECRGESRSSVRGIWIVKRQQRVANSTEYRC